MTRTRYRSLLSSVVLVSLLTVAACGGKPVTKEIEAQPAAAPPEQPVASAAAPAPPAPAVEAVRPRPAEPSVKLKPAKAPRAVAAPPAAPAPPPPTAAVIRDEPVRPPRESNAPAPAPVEAQPVFPLPAAPPPPPVRDEPVARTFKVPSGTLIPVRMIDSVDSKTDRVGQTFKASLEEDVVVNGQTVLRKGDDAYVKLTRAQSAGNVRGRSELQLQLDRIINDSGSYAVESNIYETQGAAQGTRTARNVGIGAAIGAAIGAIAGGGKGAAIGAGAGAGGGAAASILLKGEQVRVDSETPLTFRLERSLEVTLR